MPTPNIELLCQQYAYLTNIQQQNYIHPATYSCLMAQKLLEKYRLLTEQQRYVTESMIVFVFFKEKFLVLNLS